MTTIMALSADEVRLVTKHREHLEYLKLRAEKQRTCDHNWRFVAHGHNDSLYDCTKCGASKEV